MEGINVKISGSFKGEFDWMAANMPRFEKQALYHAAFFLRDKVKESIISNVPKATVRNPKYSDTLADAVFFTRPDGATINVNALGSRKSTSGTYRTRFFENNTKDRYQKSYAGVKLKKKRFLGHITGTHFFSSAVTANRTGVENKMLEILTRYVQIAQTK